MISTLTDPMQTTARSNGQMAYILSASHSGSTLLAMLLGSQERACTVGELRAPSMGDVEAYRCSCGEKIRECQFWIRVGQAMAGRGIENFDITNAGTSIYEVPSRYAGRLIEPLQRGPFLEAVRDTGLALSPAWRKYLIAVQHRNASLVEVLAQLTDADLVIDSSKAVLHLKYLLRNPRLKIKVVHLVRDGRAVTLSLIGHGLKRLTREKTVAAAAREWRRSLEAAECLLELLPTSQWLQVSYEDLCRQPEEVLRRVCDFLGLHSEKLNMDFRAREQHVLGNEMRLKSTSQIRLDERWRTQLSAEDLQVFARVAGGMNQRY
ncbi:MAG TPA: sulfotransferase, partial [Verrucomicrobiae bacterium]